MRLLKQTFMSAIAIYAEHFFGLIASLLVARNLTQSDYGLYSSTIWFAGIITLSINSGMLINVTKFVSEFKLTSSNLMLAFLAYIRKIHLIRIFLVASAFSIYALLERESHLALQLLYLLIFSAILKADYSYRMSICKGVSRFDILAKVSLIVTPSYLVLILFCVLYSPTLENFILIYCTVCIIYWLTSLYFRTSIPIAIADNKLISPHKKRIIIQILGALIIIFAGALMFRQSQVFILQEYNFLAEAGYFNIGFVLSTAVMTLIPGVYKEVLLPKIMKAKHDGTSDQQIIQSEKYILILSLLVAIPVFMYAENIVNLLYGERYLPAAFALQAIIIFQVVHSFKEGPNLSLISHDQQHKIASSNILLLVIGLSLSFFIVPKFGLKGALSIFGSLTVLHVLSFRLLARKYYKGTSFFFITRVVAAAIPSTASILLINIYFSGLLSVFIGSFVYVFSFITLLFIFKGYDKSLMYIIKEFSPSLPKPVRLYLKWGVNRFTD
ncbi:MAG: O-antigen/teichoic acid export membrane protein [Polaribacter sp.]|jgi:O-antigen/teichoic acid export membrane protein